MLCLLSSQPVMEKVSEKCGNSQELGSYYDANGSKLEKIEEPGVFILLYFGTRRWSLPVLRIAIRRERYCGFPSFCIGPHKAENMLEKWEIIVFQFLTLFCFLYTLRYHIESTNRHQLWVTPKKTVFINIQLINIVWSHRTYFGTCSSQDKLHAFVRSLSLWAWVHFNANCDVLKVDAKPFQW